MTDEELIELRAKLGGYEFEVEEDPDDPEFYSVFAYKDTSGAEVAGKIGERSVAASIASGLAQLCR